MQPQINVGDKVIYSINGIGQVGVVLRIETKSVCNKQIEFFVVKVLDSSLIVYSPKNTDSIKIRKLSNKLNLEAAYHVLKNDIPKEMLDKRWDKCVSNARAMLGYSAPLYGQAECLSYLSKIKNKRNLSFEERKLYQEVKESFLSEVSEITNVPKSKVESELNQYLV